MTQKVQVITYSDLTSEEGATTVTFGFGSSIYEIDLTVAEHGALAAALQPYISSGRRLSGRGAKTTSPGGVTPGTAPADGPSARDVRAWAAKSGIKVSDRGRIPADIQERYAAEN